MDLAKAKYLCDRLRNAEEYLLPGLPSGKRANARAACKEARDEIVRARADMMVILQELRTAEQYLKNSDLEQLEFALGVIHDVAHRAVSGDRL